MKITPTSRSSHEFMFLLTCPLDMIGETVGFAVAEDPSGYSALECWFAADTHGRNLPCREPELLSKVIRSKKSVNLQIRLWAEDIADGMILRQHELARYTADWPAWVFRAVMEQASKICLSNPRVGFIPRFARAEYFLGSLWTPEMDSFDPLI